MERGDICDPFLDAVAAGDQSGALPITPVGRAAELPLSFAQQRLWFLDQLQPGNPAYNIATGVELNGPLDLAVLRHSLALVVARHEALRTTFALVEGQPVQRIAPAHALPVPLLDLTALPAADQPPVAERLATLEARSPFDLACGPLLRVLLLRRHPERHLLLLTAHHIVSDGWSMGVLVRELTSAYAAISRGQPSMPPPLPIQYADYAAWQRQWLHDALLERQLAYWTAQLHGAPALLDLPTDFPRSARSGFRGARQAVALTPELVAQLQALSQRAGTTLFMTLLAGFALLLAHYSGQDDLVIGTPITGRTRAETEGLIGCFVNTLALRIDLAGNPSFVELLARVRAVALDADAHQELPFEQLVEALQPTRSLSHTPLFQVVFAFGTTPLPQMTASDLTITRMDVYGGTTPFDLTLALDSRRPDLGGWLEYSAELFEDATITRMLVQFQTLLAGIAAAPGLPLAALPLSTPAEQQALLALGAASASFPVRACLHQLVEQQADCAPDAIALVAPDGQLSYGTLIARARQLAHILQAHGVGRETIVGVFLDPSLDLVIALLAILQAGGAYLPLDPAAPPARRAAMLQDARAILLLTQPQLHDHATAWPVPVLWLADVVRTAATVDAAPPAPADPAQLAYLIYTSGSTGTPKGTLIPHANVVRLLLAAQPACGFGPADRWTLGHALSFDFAVWELWGALVGGGCLVLLPALLRRSPAALWALLVRERISVLNQTPAAFQLLLEAALAAPAGAGSLRLVIFGGEALDAARLAPWVAQFGVRQPQLLNMYGITETTVHVTRRWLTADDVAVARGGSRIGSGLADLALYVRLAGGQPAPLGVPGELYVGGAGLARGYLGRPDLTAERFVPNPFLEMNDERRTTTDDRATDDQPVVRLYKTGDRVRWLANGELEYLGRLDQQVKLRGYRIELGEVAAALRAHPGVRDAVAALGRGADGGARLVAYVVQGVGGRDQGPGDASVRADRDPPRPLIPDLRSWMKTQLPDYMLPAAYVLLERLPLTAHGKLDRAALPPPTDERPDLETSYVAPRTPVEQVLAGVWAEVLGVAQVGLYDNFFELGGHSLLVTQVIARLQEVFPVVLPVRIFFEWPSVAELADGLGRLGQEAAIDIEMIAQIFIQIAQFSEDEARSLLAEKTQQN
jgi:amino acid adenylation domain-containing protein